jgi:hypothetical protein
MITPTTAFSCFPSLDNLLPPYPNVIGALYVRAALPTSPPMSFR